MKKNFKDEAKKYFIDYQYKCWQCGRAKPCELHHILGRCSNSPLNAAPLCRECHNRVAFNKKEKIVKYLRKTLYILSRQNYDFKKRDTEFYRDNHKLYEGKQL